MGLSNLPHMYISLLCSINLLRPESNCFYMNEIPEQVIFNEVSMSVGLGKTGVLNTMIIL